MSYTEFSQKSRSEKVTLAIVEAVQVAKLFTLHSGAVYKRVTEHFVKAVKQDDTVLTEVFTTSLLAGQFYFDAKNKTLYVRMTDGSNPKTKQVSLTYKMFFSTAPYNLPHDLNTGEDVEFEARILDAGPLGQQLDDQNTGIVLESSSKLTLMNNDGYFDGIFDTMIWENRAVSFYSWSPSIPASEAKKLFDGFIESKDFSATQITFSVKDFVYKLKNQVNLPLFTEADGNVSPSHMGTPKRRIYGQVKQLQCVGIDKILDGIDLTGTIAGTTDAFIVTGTGTVFLDQLTPGDEISFSVNGEAYKVGVQSVDSNTQFTTGSKLPTTFSGLAVKFKPSVPWRFANRSWSIAGHKLRSPITSINFIQSSNRVTVDSVADLYPGDTVQVNDDFVQIRRLSGNQIVLETAISPMPVVGDEVVKTPVSRVFYKNKELFPSRDWVLFNADEAILTFTNLAERNIAEQRSVGVNLTFASASRTITTTAVIDLRTILKPRDWIKKNDVADAVWYEILDVKEQTVILRVPWVGTTGTYSALMKNVDIIEDDALITVDCMGMEHDGEWVKTASDAVRHLVLNDAGISNINEDSFTLANADCGYILSLPIPLSIGDKSPDIKSVVTMINDSVFGSLYGNSSWDVSYSVLNARKPETLDILKDDDILSFSVSSESRILNAIKVNFRPFTDIFNGESAFETYSWGSTFVDRLIGYTNSEEKTLFLYEEDKAKIIAQRIIFQRSLANCKVRVVSSLNLTDTSVNDKMFLALDRLYKRYGGGDKIKIGVVTSVKKSGFSTEVEMIDLGNIFNRVASVAPNTATSYTLSTSEDRARWAYLLDNDTLTPDPLSENGLGTNLVG